MADKQGTNRQQRLMKHALDDISKVEPDLKDTYKGLCNSFPTMILSCGLCQALSFVESKMGDNKALSRSHAKIFEQVYGVLQSEHMISGSREQMLSEIAKMDTRQYMMAMQILMDAWTYYKRFATSMIQ